MANKNKQTKTKNPKIVKDLDYWLDEVSVMRCSDMVDDFSKGDDMHTLNTLIKDWYAVVNEEGIIAYFGRENDAFRFRLDYINRKLNP